MPPIQKALGIVGLSKQAAKGTPDAEPDFVFGLTSGGMFKVDVDQSAEERTLDASLIAPDANRMSVVPGQAYKTRAFPKSVGLVVYGALGAIASSGSTNYTHVVTPSTDLPYLTGWGKFGGTLYRVQDAKVDELELTWSGAGPLEVGVTLVGTTLGFPGSITPGVDDQQANYLRAAGGTFKVDAASGTPATAPIKAGTVRIANNVAPVLLSSSVVPDDIAIGRKTMTVNLTLVVNNLDEWRKTVTGSAGGTTVSQLAVKGSFDVLFTIDGDTSLQVVAPSVAFTADFPEASPSGGATELELAGTVLLPAAGAAMTATVKNQHASY